MSPRRNWKPLYEEIIEKYDNGKSPGDISELYNCRRELIKNIISRKHKLRNQSEASLLAIKNGKKDKSINALILSAKTTNRFNPLKINRGEKNGNWLGDRKLLKRPMCSVEGKLWRLSIYERDNFTCQKCGQIGGKLQAHHIKDYWSYPKLRWDINNGITLCVDCHKKTDNYGWKSIHIRKGKKYVTI